MSGGGGKSIFGFEREKSVSQRLNQRLNVSLLRRQSVWPTTDRRDVVSRVVQQRSTMYTYYDSYKSQIIIIVLRSNRRQFGGAQEV